MNNNFIFLVVVYNKKLEDSTTLKTLLKYDLAGSKVVIHNNGPENVIIPHVMADLFSKINCTVELINCVSNKPLGTLYNEFVVNNTFFDKYIILDDDSTITDSYIDFLHQDDYDLGLPKIISIKDGVTYYPIKNDDVVLENAYLDIQGVFSIGSGLIFTRLFLDTFSKYSISPFDDRYALYGVDFSLFRRMRKLSNKSVGFRVKTCGKIFHSLSRTEGEESRFRCKERLIDLSLTTRHYPTFKIYSDFLKKIIKETLFCRFGNLYAMFVSYLCGSHPRCRKINCLNRPLSKK
ncbi:MULTISPECIES: glycosyl transferase [Klebsiella pneumoniae complex]|uniref:glycosyl transferase n=1 Tax=Klebsiella pneumoniae complex TaxID=3390273 RepID=UPI001C7702EB|nr:glycosyl transferase [Klebsiella quasipneumoniae]QYD23136.1 glycosyl transferase [Klebsiella quasipneumoniae]